MPPNEWKILRIGDFNVNLLKNSSEKELLLKLSRLMGLRVISPLGPTRKNSTLDIIIVGNKITPIEDSRIKGSSDHFALTWQLQIEANERMKPIKIPSKTTAEEISLALINDKEITDAENFIHHLGRTHD